MKSARSPSSRALVAVHPRAWLAALRRSAWARAALGALLAPVLALAVAAVFEPLPEALRGVRPSDDPSLRVLDGERRLLGDVRNDAGRLARGVSLAELPPEVPSAMLAAEDARFYSHPGIDPVAMGRAALQALWHRRVVSGASTLTQQLARNVVPRPRTLGGKLREMAIALRIEASLSKRRILEEYLSRVEFGPGIQGIEAASRYYFDKPAQKLSLAEAATLAGMPRGPSLYDPRRGTERVQRRRDRVLARMLERGWASEEAVRIAQAEPVQLTRGRAEGGAPHFVRALERGLLEPALRGEPVAEVVTTLSLDLQREVTELARGTVERIESVDASAASVIVIDNASGDILAYVGSPYFSDSARLGQNDGVLALRQPGSTLKPFVYAAAMQRLGFGAETLLPDVELHLPTPEGDYSPKNYDGRFHGPVRLREALGNSLNVPAVFAAQEVGPDGVLAVLHAVGFLSLDRSPSHYGAAIALGDGEVTLAELANAYATLARDGAYRPLRAVKEAKLSGGGSLVLPPRADTQAIPRELAVLVTDMLSDPSARALSFGRGSVLELPFPVAVKTGTSKGFRDNWTVGYTRERTVGVWVGNFDGHSMNGSSGVTGAAPLFREVMLAAMRGREPEPLAPPELLAEGEVCALSGKRPSTHCAHRVRERFVRGREPAETCDFHVEIAVDPRNGLRAGPACSHVERVTGESFPARYVAWAKSAGRALVPSEWSPACPGTEPRSSGEVGLSYPFPGARFVRDPSVPRASQAIVLAARVPHDVTRVSFHVDGRRVASEGAPFRAPWALTPGEHAVHVETSDGRASAPVRFSVE